MQIPVKVNSVKNTRFGNMIQLKVDPKATAHALAASIEKKRNSDTIDITLDDVDNSIEQGDTFMLVLIPRTEEALEPERSATTMQAPAKDEVEPDKELVADDKEDGPREGDKISEEPADNPPV